MDPVSREVEAVVNEKHQLGFTIPTESVLAELRHLHRDRPENVEKSLRKATEGLSAFLEAYDRGELDPLDLPPELRTRLVLSLQTESPDVDSQGYIMRQRPHANRRLASGERFEASTDLLVAGTERPDAFGQKRLADGLQVVECRCAGFWKSVFGVQGNLRGNLAYRAGDGRDDDPGQHGDRFAAGDYKNRAALVGSFGPPDFALSRSHHGSSAIMAMVALSAHPTSSAVWAWRR